MTGQLVFLLIHENASGFNASSNDFVKKPMSLLMLELILVDLCFFTKYLNMFANCPQYHSVMTIPPRHQMKDRNYETLQSRKKCLLKKLSSLL